MIKETAYLVAIEIGGTKLQAVLGLADGTIVESRRGRVNPEEGAAGILEWCRTNCAALIEKATASGKTVQAIGIGFGGPVESGTGQVLVSHQIEGWQGVPLKHRFEEWFKVPAIVANDANAAGWAEYCCGAGQGTRNFVYMNIGSGIGGALVVEGQLYDGQGRGACEIGHTWVPDWTSGDVGAVDKLEHLCSGWAIERRIRSAAPPPPGTPLYERCDGDPARLSCALLAEAAREGDALALKEIRQVAASVAISLGNVVTLFHPERIALGGGVALMGDVLINPINEALTMRMFAPFKDSVQLVPCKLEEDVVLVGALLLAGAQP
ncbi:MAG: ROK family protein [Candidatus Hydrogenedens sp.]|jgi:glucokinase|nr:ROK family protein [Candidatus Hydrogenedens sp.]